MSHSPLLNLPGPSQDLLDDVNAGIAQARAFVEEFDPELVDLALLPPVIERMSKVKVEHAKTGSRPGRGRRARRREEVPDVSFRWRSESLGTRRIRASG